MGRTVSLGASLSGQHCTRPVDKCGQLKIDNGNLIFLFMKHKCMSWLLGGAGFERQNFFWAPKTGIYKLIVERNILIVCLLVYPL